MRDGSNEPGAISPGYANYVLGVLFTVYVINFIDRQILAVFIGPIKEEFGVSDTAMGLLVGFAFALFYTFAGIPIARWADRGNRRSIIAIGLTVLRPNTPRRVGHAILVGWGMLWLANTLYLTSLASTIQLLIFAPLTAVLLAFFLCTLLRALGAWRAPVG